MSEIQSVMSDATSGRSFRRWYWAIRAAAIAIPVIGALPTVVNLYYSYRHGIPFAQVYHKLNQYELWQKNGDCRIDYREISASKGAKVNVGACPSTGDISIKVSLAGGKQSYEWLAFDQLQRTTLLDFFVTHGARPGRRWSHSLATSEFPHRPGRLTSRLSGLGVEGAHRPRRQRRRQVLPRDDRRLPGPRRQARGSAVQHQLP